MANIPEKKLMEAKSILIGKFFFRYHLKLPLLFNIIGTVCKKQNKKKRVQI